MFPLLNSFTQVCLRGKPINGQVPRYPAKILPQASWNHSAALLVFGLASISLSGGGDVRPDIALA